MKLSAVSAAVAALALLGSADAATYTYNGDTTGAATYNRLFDDLTAGSLLGANVNFQALSFSVSASGSYSFVSQATGNWDNFTFLYSPSFTAASPVANALVANDDLGPVGSSGFSYTLAAGINYVLVTTGFEGGFDFGAYVNTIDGPGTVTPVPEAGTYAMMALGLAAIGLRLRRRIDA